MEIEYKKDNLGRKLVAIVAIIGLCLIITGVIIKTMAYYKHYLGPDWEYGRRILWNTNGHIIQAIGILVISSNFIWAAIVMKEINSGVRASLVVGSIILIAVFIMFKL